MNGVGWIQPMRLIVPHDLSSVASLRIALLPMCEWTERQKDRETVPVSGEYAQPTNVSSLSLYQCRHLYFDQSSFLDRRQTLSQ